MDNLTHSLAGAILGQMGLKKKTGLAMPTLIIAANLPDIDAVAVLMGGQGHLAMRRGITHGPIALMILPIILWAVMVWFDRWQQRRGKRPAGRLPVHKGWLLLLAFIGTLSHPALDWLNTYGIRFLEPFTDKWFYGDTLFIIDIWVWAALIAGMWISLRREKRGQGNWQRPAWISFTAICAYIFANGAITGHAEALMHDRLDHRAPVANSADTDLAPIVVAQPVPVKFWQREMLWRHGAVYGTGWFSLGSGLSAPSQTSIHRASPEAIARYSAMDENARAFLFWSRMPIIAREGGEVVIRDQRFLDPRVGDRFGVRLKAAGQDKDEDVPSDRLKPAAQ